MARENVKRTIERLNRAYCKAYNAGELEKVLNLFAEDAITLSPDQEPVHGQEALRRYYEAGFQREPQRGLVLASIRAEAFGGAIYDAGEWRQSLPMPDGKLQAFRGYYLSVYRKLRGKWKVVANTFNWRQSG